MRQPDQRDFAVLPARASELTTQIVRTRGSGAIYPIQINERVRAQRGWFTIHGDDRRPLEDQLPRLVGRLDLEPEAVREVMSTVCA